MNNNQDKQQVKQRQARGNFDEDINNISKVL